MKFYCVYGVEAYNDEKYKVYKTRETAIVIGVLSDCIMEVHFRDGSHSNEFGPAIIKYEREYPNKIVRAHYAYKDPNKRWESALSKEKWFALIPDYAKQEVMYYFDELPG